MSRNEELRFNHLPDIEISRSRFNLDHSVKTTFNCGEVVPFECFEVLPGDTVDISTNIVARLQPLVAPIYDNLFLDTYYFYVPNRLVWSHFKEFMGEDPVNPWDNPVEYTVPQLRFPAGTGIEKGTIADYLGLPINKSTDQTVSALPFRAYALICNDWFRDTNVMNGVHLWTDDTTRYMSNGSDQVTDIELGGKPFIACKTHDYFTSALRDAQRGNPALVNTGTIAPVVSNSMFSDSSLPNKWFTEIGDTGESAWSRLGGSKIYNYGRIEMAHTNTSPQKLADEYTGSGITGIGVSKTDGSAMELFSGSQSSVSGQDKFPFFDNLSSYIYNFSGFTTNELRQAFAVQKFMEKSARGGNRYRDLLYSQFGVTASDASLQRSEYLGGSRIPIEVSQVTQTSASTGSGSSGQYLGDVAGQSVTMDSSNDIFRSFDEHGWIIGVMVLRYDHTYSQGIPRMFSRKSKFDFYFPVFSNLGEQIVRRKELYLNSTTEESASSLDMKNDSAFGYQEAWAEYRYFPNRLCSEMRPDYAQSLDMWHLGDHYSSAPTLSSAWLREDKANLDRCLAVTSAVSDQMFADIFVQNTMTRPMPLYSIPGLIDHH